MSEELWEYEPDVLRFGVYGWAPFEVLWNPDPFKRGRSGFGTRCPSIEDWKGFWATLDQIGIWEWEESYEAGYFDAGNWELEIVYGDKHIKSQGDILDTPSSMGRFLRALGTLVENSYMLWMASALDKKRTERE